MKIKIPKYCCNVPSIQSIETRDRRVALNRVQHPRSKFPEKQLSARQLSPYPHALRYFPLFDSLLKAEIPTMVESNSHQPPAASPSPPPPAPIPQSPGPRASRLNQVFEQALARTLRANSYANFAGCFPTPARHVPASLEGVWRQLNAKLEANAKAEFDDIVAERDAVAHLNELDRLVGDARARKEQEGENAEGQERTVYVDCIWAFGRFFRLCLFPSSDF